MDWKKYVEIDPRYYRPTDVDILLGDCSKARRILGWKPKVRFEELVRLMVEADFEAEAKRPASLAASADHELLGR
jgi:GDPmannose 4,6-dehydratase